MSRMLSIHESAEREIEEESDFYDLESIGLGNVFIDDVQKAIDNISQFPEAATLVQDKLRKKMLSKFPYALFYATYPDRIRILAVAHQKRRPYYWRKRR